MLPFYKRIQLHFLGYQKYIRLRFLFYFSIAVIVLLHTEAIANHKLICPDFPFFEPKEGPLTMVNCDFHHAYEDRVKAMVLGFGAKGGRPVILQLGGRLIFKYDGQNFEQNITPFTYHQLKALAHAPFTIYLLLADSIHQHTYKINAGLEKQFNNLLIDLKRSENLVQVSEGKNFKLLNSKGSENDGLLMASVLKRSESFLMMVLQRREFSPAEVHEYFAHVLPDIGKMLQRASQIELNSLDQAIDGYLKKLNGEERKRLGVAIAVAHQARAKEISLQYFARKFGFRYGEGALEEHNFVVIEDKFDEASALALLARHFIDREAATFMYNVPHRLQYDLLGDEAQKLIEKKK